MKKKLKKGILLGIGYVILKWTILGTLGASLYKKGLWSNWYLAILPLIGLVIFLFKKKKQKVSK